LARRAIDLVSRLLVLSAAPGEVRAGLVEDGVVVALRVEREAEASLVGALFLGRIARVVPAVPGAFIDLGLDRPAFLPGVKLAGGPLVEGTTALVEIVKDAHEDKAPEVSAAPSFHGKLAVWTPGKIGASVSRRIAPAERARLADLLTKLVGPGEGVVLRSHACGATEAELAEDVSRLRADHAALLGASAVAKPPVRLDPVLGAAERIARALGPGVDRIAIDDRATHTLLKRRLDPTVAAKLDFDGGVAFDERHGLADAIEAALAPRVALTDGAEIVIESGLGGTLIDVNLGAAAGGRGRSGDMIRRVNLAAAAAVARHLRLRNIAGAIIVDFIAMSARDHRREVEIAFAAAAEADSQPIALHGWTRLGHLELTRKRGLASIGDIMLAPPGERRAKTPLTTALEALRALTRGAFPPGALELRVARPVAVELTGRLAREKDAAAAQLGRRLVISIEPGRDPETFDIGAIAAY
jgi:ribonuclease G